MDHSTLLLPLYRHKRVVAHALIDADQEHLLAYREEQAAEAAAQWRRENMPDSLREAVAV